MLGISSLVNDSVPRGLLGAGAEFPVLALEEAVFLFPLEDPEVVRVAGGRELTRVEGLLALGELMKIFLLSHLRFYCDLLIARYGACAVILISAPCGHVLLLFIRRLPGDCSHINFV